MARLKEPFTRWPPMAVLGRAGSEALAERFARALARELTAVGITLDYAPVLDIHTNPKNPVIGDRALAERADEVSRLGRAIIRGLQGEGVAACGKHFPGHGDTSTDSHVELPLVEHPPDRLRAVEFEPFRAADSRAGRLHHDGTRVRARAGRAAAGDAVTGGRPADSPRGTRVRGRHPQRRPRDESDQRRMPVPVAAVQAIQAGCDGVLVCSGDVETQAATLEALVRAAETGEIRPTRLDDAFTRLRRAKDAIPVAGTAADVGSHPGPARRHRSRRASGDRRGDGCLPVTRTPFERPLG